MPDKSNAQASPAQIAQALGGLDYPKRKDEVVDYARQHNVDNNPDVIDVLERLPDREYGSMADLEKAVGRVE